MHQHPDLFQMPEGVEIDADMGVIIIRYECGDGRRLTLAQARWQLDEIQRFGQPFFEAVRLLEAIQARWRADAQRDIDDLAVEFRQRMEDG